ncbi:multiple epidermal growth factor-like domains protein 6 [Salvelinus sp. IW2-2015]|uniref:multiple epidermal growth factor-like domains protein 6 n=1 Tax=Salvelinus sp. IW2-2015 TaxID=2691554 RepID=UPI0038D41F78
MCLTFLSAPSSECDPGTFGPGCENKCECPLRVSCDHVTGSANACARLVAWRQLLSRGEVWAKLHQACDCSGAPCDRVSGQCQCPAGTSGKRCENVCVKGFWGAGCREACPACENGGVCDKHNGTCSCPPGYMGRLCQNSCPTGRFGVGCQLRCLCENSGRCHPVTGRCTCAPGWAGHNCRKACDARHWGVDCAEKCDCKDGDGSCDAVTASVTSVQWAILG